MSVPENYICVKCQSVGNHWVTNCYENSMVIYVSNDEYFKIYQDKLEYNHKYIDIDNSKTTKQFIDIDEQSNIAYVWNIKFEPLQKNLVLTFKNKQTIKAEKKKRKHTEESYLKKKATDLLSFILDHNHAQQYDVSSVSQLLISKIKQIFKYHIDENSSIIKEKAVITTWKSNLFLVIALDLCYENITESNKYDIHFSLIRLDKIIQYRINYFLVTRTFFGHTVKFNGIKAYQLNTSNFNQLAWAEIYFDKRCENLFSVQLRYVADDMKQILGYKQCIYNIDQQLNIKQLLIENKNKISTLANNYDSNADSDAFIWSTSEQDILYILNNIDKCNIMQENNQEKTKIYDTAKKKISADDHDEKTPGKIIQDNAPKNSVEAKEKMFFGLEPLERFISNPLDRCVSNPLTRCFSDLSTMSQEEDGATFVPFGRKKTEKKIKIFRDDDFDNDEKIDEEREITPSNKVYVDSIAEKKQHVQAKKITISVDDNYDNDEKTDEKGEIIGNNVVNNAVVQIQDNNNKNMIFFGTRYEVKCDETFAYFDGYVFDYDEKEQKLKVAYTWKADQCVAVNYVRPLALPVKDNWKPKKGDDVECKAKAKESQPFGWWQCTIKSIQDNFYLIGYKGWDNHHQVLQYNMLRPCNHQKPFVDDGIVREFLTISRERIAEFKSVLMFGNVDLDSNHAMHNAQTTISQLKRIAQQTKLIHLNYSVREEGLILIGNKKQVSDAKMLIKYVWNLRKLYKKTEEIQRNAYKELHGDDDDVLLNEDMIPRSNYWKYDLQQLLKEPQYIVDEYYGKQIYEGVLIGKHLFSKDENQENKEHKENQENQPSVGLILSYPKRNKDDNDENAVTILYHSALFIHNDEIYALEVGMNLTFMIGNNNNANNNDYPVYIAYDICIAPRGFRGPIGMSIQNNIDRKCIGRVFVSMRDDIWIQNLKTKQLSQIRHNLQDKDNNYHRGAGYRVNMYARYNERLIKDRYNENGKNDLLLCTDFIPIKKYDTSVKDLKKDKTCIINKKIVMSSEMCYKYKFFNIPTQLNARYIDVYVIVENAEMYINLFLNEGCGGSIYFGVNEKGTIVGQKYFNKKKRRYIRDAIGDRLYWFNPSIPNEYYQLYFKKVIDYDGFEIPDRYVIVIHVANLNNKFNNLDQNKPFRTSQNIYYSKQFIKYINVEQPLPCPPLIEKYYW